MSWNTGYNSGYGSFSNDYSYYTKQFKNPYQFSTKKPSADLINNLYKSMFPTPIPSVHNRSFLGRIGDALMVGVYPLANEAKSMVTDALHGQVSFSHAFKALGEGFKASNPFGNGNPSGATTWSDVIESAGWKPTTLGGKIIKGTLGFTADILLDPTTYFSGGTTALLKGTGKVGAIGRFANKVGKGIAESNGITFRGLGTLPDDVAKATMDKFATNPNVNQDLVARLALKKKDETLKAISDASQHMTLDRAKELITSRSLQQGFKVEDLNHEATQLMNEYNRLRGFRLNPEPFNFSLGNAPFGKYIFGKNLASQTAKFGDGTLLQKIGDHTFAPMYSRLRHAVYGSIMGKLFSNTSKLYKLAETDPSKLYDVLRFANYTKGLSKDKILREQQIRDMGEQLAQLSPSDNKELLDLMENPKAWNKVVRTIKFANTEDAVLLKEMMNQQRLDYQYAIHDIQDKMNQFDTLHHADVNKVLDAKNELVILQDEIRQKLDNLDNYFHGTRSQLLEHKKLLSEQIKRMEETFNKATTTLDPEKFDRQLRSDLLNKFQKSQDSFKQLHVHRAKTREILTKAKVFNPKEVPNGYIRVKGNHYIDSNELKKTLGLANDVNLHDAVIKHMNNAPSIQPRVDWIDSVSQYLFGTKGQISYHTSYDNLREVMNMIRDGKSKSEIEDYMTNLGDFFSGKAHTMYSFIADLMGYGEGKRFETWKQMYTDRVKPLMDKIKNGETLTKQEIQLFNELDSLRMKRLAYRAKLERLTPDQLIVEKSRYLDQQLQNDFQEIEHLSNSQAKRNLVNFEEQRRNRFNNEDRAMGNDKGTLKWESEKTLKVVMHNGQKYEKVIRINKDGKPIGRPIYKSQYGQYFRYNKATKEMLPISRTTKVAPSTSRVTGEFNDKPIRDFIHNDLSTSERKQLMNDVYLHILSASHIDPEHITPTIVNRMNQIVYEVESLLKSDFKQGYNNLTSGAKALLFKRAIHNASRFDPKKTNVKLTQFFQPIQKQLEEKLVTEKIDAVISTVKPEDTVYFSHNGESYRGTVHSIELNDGQYTLKVEIPDGSIVDAKPTDVFKIKTNTEKITPEELVARSDLSSTLKSKMNLIADEIFKTDGKLKGLERTYRDTYQSIMDNFKDASRKFQNNVYKQQRNLDKLREQYFKDEHLNPNDIDYLSKRINEIDNALASDDAFETYVSTYYADKLKPTLTAKIVFNNDLTENEKVKELAKVLRAEFIKIGKSEVEIKRLSQEQFEQMAYHYLTHVPTDDAMRFLNKNRDKLERKGLVSQDFGYGLRFNPYRISRTTKGTISKLNDFFKQDLHGKNFFSESVADIYIARALKNSDLLFDDGYMKTMLNQFGKEIDHANPIIEDGYKAVANFGMMKKTLHDIADMELSLEISNALSSYLKDEVIAMHKAYWSKEKIDAQIKILADEFLKQNYPDAVRAEKYDSFFKDALSKSDLNERMLQDIATPLVELTPEQIKRMHGVYEDISSRYADHLKLREDNAVFRGNFDSYKYLKDAKKRFSEMSPFETKQVNDVIVFKANQARKAQILKNEHQFLKLWDKFTHLIKLGQTTVMPSFHARNKQANTFLNWLALGGDAVNINNQRIAYKVIRAKGDAKKLTEIPQLIIHHKDGTVGTMKYSDAYDLARLHGAIDEGFFAKDIGASAETNGILKFLPAKLDPTSTKTFGLYKMGTAVGSVIENMDRFIHFTTQLSRGMTPEEATLSVKQFLFDYSDLTSFEQNVMKRIIPYYTWLRKNARLQLGQLLEQPYKYRDIIKVMQGINDMNNSDERLNRNLLADFATDWIQLPIQAQGKHGLKPILWNPNLPFMDFNRIPDPSRPVYSLMNLFTQSNPLIKVPIEETLNTNFFFNEPIVGKNDNPITPRIKHILSQFALYNAGEGLGTKTGTDLGLQVLNDVSGLKFLSYDENAFKAMKIKQLLDEIKQNNR